jgi:hypothetical protein
MTQGNFESNARKVAHEVPPVSRCDQGFWPTAQLPVRTFNSLEKHICSQFFNQLSN